MLLAAVAQTGREGATAAQPRDTRTHVEGGAEQPGSLAFGRDRESANRAIERDASTLWLSHAIGSSGLLKRLFQPPDAENRTSGGVGGWRGAIPVTRPDPDFAGGIWLSQGDTQLIDLQIFDIKTLDLAVQSV